MQSRRPLDSSHSWVWRDFIGHTQSSFNVASLLLEVGSYIVAPSSYHIPSGSILVQLPRRLPRGTSGWPGQGDPHDAGFNTAGRDTNNTRKSGQPVLRRCRPAPSALPPRHRSRQRQLPAVTVRSGPLTAPVWSSASIVVAGPRVCRRASKYNRSPLRCGIETGVISIGKHAALSAAFPNRSWLRLAKSAVGAADVIVCGDIIARFRAWIRRRLRLHLGVYKAPADGGCHRRRLVARECRFRLGHTKGARVKCFRHRRPIARSHVGLP